MATAWTEGGGISLARETVQRYEMLTLGTEEEKSKDGGEGTHCVVTWKMKASVATKVEDCEAGEF